MNDRYGTVNSSSGDLRFHPETGIVTEWLPAEPDDGNLRAVVRLDVDEWRKAYPGEDVRGPHDILDFGVWRIDGRYDGPSAGFRAEYRKAASAREKTGCAEWKVWLHVEGLDEAGDQVEGDGHFLPVCLGSFQTREAAENFAAAAAAETADTPASRTRAAYEILRQVKNELKDRGFMTLALRLAEAQDMLDERTD